MPIDINLSSLPQDILLLVVRYLEAYDLLRLQIVSRSCCETFTDEIYLRTVLRSYPNAREIRALALSSLEEKADLQALFQTVATRYYHLSLGKARRLQRLNLRALDQSGQWYPTPQWDYHESQPGGRLYHESAAAHLRGMGWKPYLFRQTLWDYHDGLIVYCPSRDHSHPNLRFVDGGDQEGEIVVDNRDLCLRVLDLESGAEGAVPFDVHGKIIRNLRLKEETLIVEWAEKEPFHDLNMVDKVHRHFATCYDIIITETEKQSKSKREAKDNYEQKSQDKVTDKNNPSTADATTDKTGNLMRIQVQTRSEWRIHFLGLPLSSRDYFFSTHTATHYTLYYWQPNRSLWTGDEDQPIEALFIWDISSPSPYRPSEDPGNIRARRNSGDAGNGPRSLARYNMRQLEWLGIRQQANISLIKLELDSNNQTVTWRENRFVSGQGYFDPAERCWESTTTSFPFVGLGCVQRRVGDADMVSYRGHCSMDSGEVQEEVEGWFLPVCEVGDENGEVRFGLIETCFTGLMMENRVMIRVRLEEDGGWKNLDDALVKELGAMGRIAGDERWLVGQNSQLQIVVARFQ